MHGNNGGYVNHSFVPLAFSVNNLDYNESIWTRNITNGPPWAKTGLDYEECTGKAPDASFMKLCTGTLLGHYTTLQSSVWAVPQKHKHSLSWIKCWQANDRPRGHSLLLVYILLGTFKKQKQKLFPWIRCFKQCTGATTLSCICGLILNSAESISNSSGWQ